MSLRASNLTFQYFENSKQPVVENFSATFAEGKITLLAGKSGSGKSTLAYLLSGIYPENGGFLLSGEVKWKDIDILQTPPNKRVRYVAKIFQNPDLQFCMNNLEAELDFCLENIEIPAENRYQIMERVIAQIGIGHLRTRNFHELSGGEKQKCALCCVLALDAQCIILDEAFANIDGQSAREIIDVLCALGKTVVAIDHNISLWEGAYHSVFSLDGTVPKELELIPELPATGEVVLQAINLRIRETVYPPMTFRRGSITAIVGRSGAGKTTFFQSLVKQCKYQGDITFLGQDFRKVRRQEVFSKCGIVFQNPSNQFLALTVLEEITFSVKQWYKHLSEAAQREKALSLLDLFDLARYKNLSPYLLSQGQQRRLAVLTMIAGEQEILLLDEPTYGQDNETIACMMELLLERSRSGLTIIYATHNEYLARHFSHQVIKLGDSW